MQNPAVMHVAPSKRCIVLVPFSDLPWPGQGTPVILILFPFHGLVLAVDPVACHGTRQLHTVLLFNTFVRRCKKNIAGHAVHSVNRACILVLSRKLG